MSLNWDSSKCNGSVPADGDESNQRDCLVWASVLLDLGEITDANVDEWYFRLRFCEQIGWSRISDPMQRSSIHRWVGLRMNVVTLSRKKWMKKMMEQIERDVMNSMCSESLS